MSDNMKMPEGVVNAIVHDVGGLVAAVWQDFFHGVPHGNAVGNISEHGQVIGAVSDDVTVLQRNLEPVHQMQMKKLGLKPFVELDQNLDQGMGSAMGLTMLDASVQMMNENLK